ncbi:hypothetical protein ARMGADRAFT_1008591 [Armillaria gallica]|uniref:Uncharacterized protein n=1 Tax=Armillaria gallica TaxID=47427 RepID=A0A2H3E4J9_ARMGA|nr:hypothetical protein ARMGADRAFT_1008591 [Armillaria gallica]
MSQVEPPQQSNTSNLRPVSEPSLSVSVGMYVMSWATRSLALLHPIATGNLNQVLLADVHVIVRGLRTTQFSLIILQTSQN